MSPSPPDPDVPPLERLLEEQLPRLRAFVRLRMGARLRARESASDLVQSICREVLEKRDRFVHPGEENFRRWLFTTALRKVQHRAAYWQAQRRDAQREVPAEEGAAASEQLAGLYRTFSTPSAHAVAREQVERFERAFARLPDEQREVFLQVRVLGLPHQEAAAALGKSELATRSLLHRALATLARHLDT